MLVIPSGKLVIVPRVDTVAQQLFDYLYIINDMRAAFSKIILNEELTNSIFKTSTGERIQFLGMVYKDSTTKRYRLLICDCVRTYFARSKFFELESIMEEIKGVGCSKNSGCFFTACENCCRSSAKQNFNCPFPCKSSMFQRIKKTTATASEQNRDKENRREVSMDLTGDDAQDKATSMEEVNIFARIYAHIS